MVEVSSKKKETFKRKVGPWKPVIKISSAANLWFPSEKTVLTIKNISFAHERYLISKYESKTEG